MGVVYAAVDSRSGIRVALKLLAATAGGDLETCHAGHSLRREASALRDLDHPGIARFLDEGTFETPLGPRPYVATQFVAGWHLNDARARVPATSDRLKLLATVCEAAHHAHTHGVVHRDLKPENIVVQEDGRPVILDFGLARFVRPDAQLASLVTAVGQLVGTIRYMSPEQAQSSPAGVASDIYSIGVLGYELLSGQLPYPISIENVPDAILTIATREAVLLGDVDPEWRGPVEAIFARALEKRPERRYTTARDMARDLRRAAAGRRISNRTHGRTWRRWRHGTDRWTAAARRRRRFVLSLAALVPLVAFGTRWMLPKLASTPPDPPMTIESWFHFLDTADIARHNADPWQAGRSGPREVEICRLPIEMFERALALHGRIAGRPTAHAELQYIQWRLGELYLFLGEALIDPDVVQQSYQHFEAANDFPWPLLDRSTPPAHGVIDRIRRHGPQVFPGGCAHAAASLAQYRDPVTNLSRALEWRRVALERFESGAQSQATSFGSNAQRDLERALGRALLQLGAASDRLDLLDAGRAALRRVDVRSLDDGERASIHHDLGVAWARRADLTHSAADADSSRCWLTAALAKRPGDRERWLTHLELARCGLESASWHASGGALRDCEKQARTVLDDTLAARDPRRDPYTEAMTALALADLRLGLASLTGKKAHLEAASVLLERASRVVSQPKLSVPQAELLWRRGRLARLRWSLGGPDADSDEAMERLRQAATLVPAVEYPRLHRWIEAERAALRRGRG